MVSGTPTFLEDVMRTFATLFVGGAVGLLLLKLVFGLIMPLVGMFIGLVVLAIKVLLFALVAYFIYSLVRGRKRESHETA
jgi:hypothetical protein